MQENYYLPKNPNMFLKCGFSVCAMLFKLNIGRVLFTSVLLVVFSFSKLKAQDWLSGYQYRKLITLDGTKITGNQTDFPCRG